MNRFAFDKSRKQALIDFIYFWCFWTILTGLIVGVIQHNANDAIKAVLALIVPQILPTYIVSLLFDSLFLKRRVLLFFLIAIPLCYFLGLLINLWFSWIIQEDNIHANNEILIFVFTAIYIGFKYLRVAISQKILLKDEENKRIISELQLLRSQLNPHFLFNALNDIYSLILSKSDKAGEATLTLAELMRFHIELSGKQQINLSEEISMIEGYIALEKLKLDDRCKIQFNIIGSPEKIQIAPLILLPFVENAFKHGISSKTQNNFVTLDLKIGLLDIDFQISNSKPESTKTITNSTIKVGINNTLKRLELHYKRNFKLDYGIKGKEYIVNLNIKLEQNAS